MANPKDKKRADKKKAKAKFCETVRRSRGAETPNTEPIGPITVRQVRGAPRLPVAADLPTREDLSSAKDGVRAISLPLDVPDSLKALVQAIETGEYDPRAHLESVIAKTQQAKKRREEEIALYESVKDTPAAPWHGKDTPFQELMWLQAETWKPYVLFDVPPMQHDGYIMSVEEWAKYTVRCPGTHFYYANKTLPLSYSLTTSVTRKKNGKVFFDGPVVMPVLFEQLGDAEDYRQQVWMGLTPMEMITQKAGIDRARGHCVVGGLGLGWFLTEIAAKPEVREITVVDTSAELIAWIRPQLEERYPDVARKVQEWIAADIYTYAKWHLKMRGFPSAHWSAFDDTCYLLDIWPTLGDVDYDHRFVQMEQVLEEFGAGDRLWGWGRGSTYDGAPPKINPKQKLPYPRAYSRKSPCSGCPFSRTSTAEPDGSSVNALRLIGQSVGPFLLPCHQEPQYEEERQGEIYKKAQCAGAAIYRSNIGMGPLFETAPSFHLLPEDKEKVFAAPEELLAKLEGITLDEARQTLKDVSPEQLMVLELQQQQVRIYGMK